MTAHLPLATVPHNLEVEQALLGILLFDSAAYTRIEGAIRPIHFYEPFHQRLFSAIDVRASGGRIVEPAVFVDVFRDDRAFQDLGGIRYLADLVDRAPPSANLNDYVPILLDLDTRRRLIHIAELARAEAQAGQEDAEALIAAQEQRLALIAKDAGVVDHWIDGAGLCDEVNRILDGSARPKFTPTGLRTYDATLGGLQAARMNILAARPKMGKSAVGVNIGLEMAGMGLGVGMYSLEMDRGELGMRAACALAFDRGDEDNPMYFLAAKGELSEHARRRMAYGAQHLRDLPIHIDDRAGLRPHQIATEARKLIRRWEKRGIAPGCIIVDHLTIVRPDDDTGNKVQEVSAVSGALRDLARQSGVTFLVLCQLSREVDKRGVTDKRPQTSDLRWSGEIEQDAAQITFLYRPEKYLREPSGTNYASDEWLKYADDKARWANRVLFCNEENRMGPSKVEIEYGINLGCNALWEVES